jgi:3-mercaptopyruvate sulfurtransferase SseA
MRLALITFGAFLLSIFVLAACNSRDTASSRDNVNFQFSAPTPNLGTPQAPSDNARRITVTEMHDLWEKGKILVVDTRTEPAFKESHIKGAILIPAGEFAAKSGELPKDKMIVTYCT